MHVVYKKEVYNTRLTRMAQGHARVVYIYQYTEDTSALMHMGHLGQMPLLSNRAVNVKFNKIEQ